MLLPSSVSLATLVNMKLMANVSYAKQVSMGPCQGKPHVHSAPWVRMASMEAQRHVRPVRNALWDTITLSRVPHNVASAHQVSSVIALAYARGMTVREGRMPLVEGLIIVRHAQQGVISHPKVKHSVRNAQVGSSVSATAALNWMIARTVLLVSSLQWTAHRSASCAANQSISLIKVKRLVWSAKAWEKSGTKSAQSV